jgi:hypothetical protein
MVHWGVFLTGWLVEWTSRHAIDYVSKKVFDIMKYLVGIGFVMVYMGDWFCGYLQALAPSKMDTGDCFLRENLQEP